MSHASKVMLKILKARLQQYVNQELPYVQAGFIYLFIYFCLEMLALIKNHNKC